MSIGLFVVTCLAGSLGSLARFVVDGEVRRRLSISFPQASSFPWATLLINVTGSLLLGLVTGLVLGRGEPTVLRVVVGTGFCGGYTTFSTAVVETLRLAQARATGAALAYAVGTLAATTAAGAVGLLVGWNV